MNIYYKFKTCIYNIYIYIFRVGVKIRARVRDVKRILVWISRCCYAIEEIFISANMIITEFDK